MKLFTLAFGACFIALVFAESNSTAAAKPNSEYLPPIAAESAPLAQDGYHYRTVRRLKYRHRREAPPSVEYLPPSDKPSPDYLPPEGAATPVAADGYRYKTVRRLKVVRRHRREAPPSSEYLPPVAAPTNEYLPPVSDSAVTNLAKDGYRYKTVRRLRYRARHRRDVSELTSPPSVEYLPPVDANATAADSETVVGKDGYRYKTVRRLRFRQRRRRREAEEGAESEIAADAADTAAGVPVVDAVDGDGSDKVADIPVVEYLPPSNDVAEEPTSKSAELAEDGYRYKTVRRLKYRYRH